MGEGWSDWWALMFLQRSTDAQYHDAGLMTLALRWMGNLVTDEDRDRAARVWRWAGRRSLARDARPPFA